MFHRPEKTRELLRQIQQRRKAQELTPRKRKAILHPSIYLQTLAQPITPKIPSPAAAHLIFFFFFVSRSLLDRKKKKRDFNSLFPKMWSGGEDREATSRCNRQPTTGSISPSSLKRSFSQRRELAYGPRYDRKVDENLSAREMEDGRERQRKPRTNERKKERKGRLNEQVDFELVWLCAW